MNIKFPFTGNPNDIPTSKITSMRDGVVRYACPECCWEDHMHGWQKALRGGYCPVEPMPAGHLMFKEPTSYGCVPYGDSSEDAKRQALRSIVEAALHGWDQFLFDALPRKEAAAKLEAIIAATVQAKLLGADTGAWPFMACIAAGL